MFDYKIVTYDFLLEEGLNKFKVIEVMEKKGKDNNTPYLFVKLEVTDKQHKTAQVWDNIFPNKKLRDFCASIGLKEKYFDKTLSLQDFQNKEGECEIRRHEYEGKLYNRIKFYKDPDFNNKKIEIVNTEASSVFEEDDDLPF